MRNNLLTFGAGLAAFAMVFIATKVWNAPRDQRGVGGSLAKRTTGKPPETKVPDMVWMAGGEFTMGTDSDLGWPDEKPAHRVRVDGFWIDETEVTNTSSLRSLKQRSTSRRQRKFHRLKRFSLSRHRELLLRQKNNWSLVRWSSR